MAEQNKFTKTKVERARKLLAEQQRAKNNQQPFRIQYNELLRDPEFKTFRDRKSLKTFFDNVRRNVEDEERRRAVFRNRKKKEAEMKLLKAEMKSLKADNQMEIKKLLQQVNEENEKLKTTVADLEGQIEFTEWEVAEMKELVRIASEEKGTLQEEVEQERVKITEARRAAYEAERERRETVQEHRRLLDERDHLLREQERAWHIEKDRNLLLEQVDYWKGEHCRLRKVADGYVSQNFAHISRAQYEDVRRDLSHALMFKETFELATAVESKVRSAAMLFGKPPRGKTVREWKMGQMRGVLYGAVSQLRRLHYQISIEPRELSCLIENWWLERCKLSHEEGYAEHHMNHNLFHKMSYDIKDYLQELERNARYANYIQMN
jgi:hypothetical protein